MWGRYWEGIQKAGYVIAEGANIAGNLIAPLWRGSQLGAAGIAAIMGGIESLNTYCFQVLKGWGDAGQDDTPKCHSDDASIYEKVKQVICCQRPHAGYYHSLSAGYWSFLLLKATIEVYFTISALSGWYNELTEGDRFDGDITPFLSLNGFLLMAAIVLSLRFPFDATTDGQSVDVAIAKAIHPDGEAIVPVSGCGMESTYACLSRNPFVRFWVSRMGSAWHIAEHVADVVLLLPAVELGQLGWANATVLGLVGGSLVAFCVCCVGPTVGQTCLFEGREASDFMREVAGLSEQDTTHWMPKWASCLLKSGMVSTGPLMHGSGTAPSVYVALRTMTGSRAVGWTAALVFGGLSANGFRRTELKVSCAELKEITQQHEDEAPLAADGH